MFVPVDKVFKWQWINFTLVHAVVSLIKVKPRAKGKGGGGGGEKGEVQRRRNEGGGGEVIEKQRPLKKSVK